MSNNKEHYVSNKAFYNEMVIFLAAREARLERGEEPPEIPESIAMKIYKIANRLATKPNFRNYTYIEEMISDGLENSFRYIHKFNPEKSDNPFAYFTTVCYNAFVQRINKEKRQADTKSRALEKYGLDSDAGQTSTVQDHDVGEDFQNEYTQNLQESYGFKDEDERKERIRELREKGVIDNEPEPSSPLEEIME